MPELTEEKWRNIADGFKYRANFPYCLGAIDGKHIRLKKPRKTGYSYYNYKKYFSMYVIINYMLTFVDIGSYGRCSHCTIFDEVYCIKNFNKKP